MRRRFAAGLVAILTVGAVLIASPAMAASTSRTDPAKDVRIRTSSGTDAFPKSSQYLDIRKVKVSNSKTQVTVRVTFAYLKKSNRGLTSLSLEATGRTSAGAKQVSLAYGNAWGTPNRTTWKSIPVKMTAHYGKNGYIKWQFKSTHVGKAKKVRVYDVVSIVPITGNGITYWCSDSAKATPWARRS